METCEKNLTPSHASLALFAALFFVQDDSPDSEDSTSDSTDSVDGTFSRIRHLTLA